MHVCVCFVYLLYVQVFCTQTTDDVIGQTRDRVNEFVYDYSYWSLDSTAANYTSQEQVKRIIIYAVCTSAYALPYSLYNMSSISSMYVYYLG